MHAVEGQRCHASTLLDDFSTDFDLPTDRVEAALEVLTRKNGNSGAPLRVNVATGEIVLMRAGRVFMDHAVYSCDFMSWLYDQSAAELPAVEQRGRSQVKLDKAVVVLMRKLLPAFISEHPYMRPKRGITPSERKRLMGYVKHFHFGPGRWFLGRVLDEFQSYVDSPRRHVPDQRALREAKGTIEPMLARLDKIVKNEA